MGATPFYEIDPRSQVYKVGFGGLRKTEVAKRGREKVSRPPKGLQFCLEKISTLQGRTKKNRSYQEKHQSKGENTLVQLRLTMAIRFRACILMGSLDGEIPLWKIFISHKLGGSQATKASDFITILLNIMRKLDIF